MDMQGKWPYVAGAGLLLLLLLLARSGGSAGGSSTLTPVPVSSAGDDALKLQRESNNAGLLGALISSATALTGQVNGYRGAIDVTTAQYQGESMLAAAQGRTAAALATISAGRDVDLANINLAGLRDSNARDVTINRQSTDSANTVAKANARAQSNGGFWSAVGSIAGAAVKFLPFL